MNMKHFFGKAAALVLALVLLLSLCACGEKGTSGTSSGKSSSKASSSAAESSSKAGSSSASSGSGAQSSSGSESQSSSSGAGSEASSAASSSQSGSEYTPYQFDPSTLEDYDGVVEHLFFHPLVAYPEMAFDGDSKAKGIDEWMVTVGEFDKILDSLYAKGYILVNINDVWSEVSDGNGGKTMKRNTLRIPKGRKPFVLSIDDDNYYEYMLENGFTYKLIIGDDGELWSYGLDPKGNEVVSQDLDIVTILDKFVKAHPEFSLNGAKGCLALTGYEGILGYRTNTDTKSWTEAQEQNRLKEVEAVKPIVARLKATGWYFGSHTWGHINLENKGVEKVTADMTRWMNEVGSIVGGTTLMFYPFGGRPDGDDVQQSGPVFKYLHSLGFRDFFSVGIESYSKIKTADDAVIGDRLHPDGTTLRWSRDRYLKFYDAKDIYDASVRPDYGYDWGSAGSSAGTQS